MIEKLVTLGLFLWFPVFSTTLLPSQSPPGGLEPDQVSMFVSIGFDDCSLTGYPPVPSAADGGIKWIMDFLRDKKNPAGNGQTETYDGTLARVSFYLTTCYVSNMPSDYVHKVKWVLHRAYQEGHEIGNHTQTHNMQYQTAAHEDIPQSHWTQELQTCNAWLTKAAPDSLAPLDQAWPNNEEQGVGIPADEIYGFRAPFLKYNDKLFPQLIAHGLVYDCSIEEGIQSSCDGTNYYWPYTLDQGSPAHDYLRENGILNFAVTNHPGVWELPAYQAIVPPDDACAQYGISYSLRSKFDGEFPYFSASTGKISGLDFNMWMEAHGGLGMNKEEFVATLKYTLDLRLAGNRAPMLYGCHPVQYTDRWNGSIETNAAARQEAIEEFLNYALSKNVVRVVPMIDVLRWCENPVPLDNSTPSIKEKHTILKPSQITVSNNMLILKASKAGKYRIIFYTLNGKQVLTRSFFCESSGTYCIQVSRNTLPEQVYIISLENNADVFKKRVVMW